MAARRAITKEQRSPEPLLEALEQGGVDVTESSSLICPFHEDHNPSAGVFPGDDGIWRFKCHACGVMGNVIDIRKKIAEMSASDESRNVPVKPAKPVRPMPQLPRRARRKEPPPKHGFPPSLPAGVSSSHWKALGASWEGTEWHIPERDVTGDVIGTATRSPDGKKGTISGSKRGLTYAHPLRDDAGQSMDEPIVVTEGPTDAAVALALGFVAVGRPAASSGGQILSALLTGRHVLIVADNDEPGQRGANKIRNMLSKACASVRTIVPPSPSKDLRDWVKEWRANDGSIEELRNEIHRHASQADVVGTAVGPKTIPTYQPYPLEVLPDPLERYVKAVADAMRTDTACVALAALATCAAAIGTTRAVHLQRRWREHASLWAVIVAEQGSGKSPPMREAMRPLQERQQCELERHRREYEQYEAEREEYEINRKRTHNGKSTVTWEKPEPPIAVRHVISDTTTEALAPLLVENPRGVLLDGDELAGWFGHMDRYAQAKQGDAAHWRRIFDGHAITIDRKTGRETFQVMRPAVSIIGTIQPAILQRVLSYDHLESGLAARLLLAYPPTMPQPWSEQDIPASVEEEYERTINELLNLEHQTETRSRPQPCEVKLSGTARVRFIDWHDRHRAEQAGMSGALAGHWSKLVAYCARFTLVFAMIRYVAGNGKADEIEMADVDSAIAVTEWHKGEAARVFGMLEEDGETRERRRLVQMIEAEGGSVSARDWQRKRSHRSADDAKAELDDLVRNGFGSLEQPLQEGRGAPKSPVFRLNAESDTDK